MIDRRSDNDAWCTDDAEGIGLQLTLTKFPPESTGVEADVVVRIRTSCEVVFTITLAAMLEAVAIG